MVEDGRVGSTRARKSTKSQPNATRGEPSEAREGRTKGEGRRKQATVLRREGSVEPEMASCGA